MVDRALTGDGHGFETAMRMFADTTGVCGRFEFVRLCIVDQKKRTVLRRRILRRQDRADGESVSNPVELGGFSYGLELFHAFLRFVFAVSIS